MLACWLRWKAVDKLAPNQFTTTGQTPLKMAIFGRSYCNVKKNLLCLRQSSLLAQFILC